MSAYDLILKGGRVIDPANRIDKVADVAIKDDKIACVADSIPLSGAEATVDVTGMLVTPGLIDIHVHAYTGRLNDGPGLFVASLNADAHFLNSGVTTCVDTGTAGAEEMDHFRETVIEKATTRILAYVNISKPGMGAPEQTISNFDVDAAAAAADRNRDVVVGIKTAHYWTNKPFDADHPPWESVEKAVDAGTACDMPVMVDFWPRPPVRPGPRGRKLLVSEWGSCHRGRLHPRFDQHGSAYGEHSRSGDQYARYDVEVHRDGNDVA